MTAGADAHTQACIGSVWKAQRNRWLGEARETAFTNFHIVTAALKATVGQALLQRSIS